MENSLAREMTMAEAKIQYDERVKRVLAEKEILAWILKNVTSEFSEMSIEKIKPLIEGEPKISVVKVNPGETNIKSIFSGKEKRRITGLSNEDKVPEEGTIFYDIRFEAFYPLEEKYIKVIINVEAQKAYRPGYHIPTRGIFYCGRMLSAQLNTEFQIPAYDDIKKVYSIWVCMNAPDYIGNAISTYSVKKEDVIPGIIEPKSAYDKLTVVQICLNEKQKGQNDFLEMLNTLLSKSKRVEEKKEILEKKFHIEMDSRMEEEVNVMCNLSDWVEEGIKKGMETGLATGLERGAYNKMCELIQKKLQKGLSVEAIADAIEESVETVQGIIEELKKREHI